MTGLSDEFYRQKALAALSDGIFDRRSTRRTWFVCGAALVLGLLGKLLVGFRADEIEHLHFAWNIGHGLLPYRDFFEHHPPIFHYLLSPIIAAGPQIDRTLIGGSALIALLIVLGALALFYRLLRYTTPAAVAGYGVAAWLLTAPYLFKAFELRPDWLALTCLLGALVCLVEGMHAERMRSLGWSIAAGLLVGLSLDLTQKTAVAFLGAGTWLLGICMFAPDRVQRRRRLRCALCFAVGTCFPVAALILSFARAGAAGAFIRSTVLLNLGWAQEIGWQAGLLDAIASSFGIVVLGMAQAALIFSRIRDQLRDARVESLIASIGAVGVAAYLHSPTPYPQWFLFLVAPWVIYLGTLAVARYAAAPVELRRDRWRLLGAAAISATSLYGAYHMLVLIAWGAVAILMLRHLPRAEQPAQRTGHIFNSLLACSLVYNIAAFGALAYFRPAEMQMRLEAFIDSRSAPGEPILVVSWPMLAPMHPYPAYYGLSHRGVFESLAVERPMIEEQFIEVVRSKRARLVVIDAGIVEHYLPRFAQYLKAHSSRLEDVPANSWNVQVYQVVQ